MFQNISECFHNFHEDTTGFFSTTPVFYFKKDNFHLN